MMINILLMRVIKLIRRAFSKFDFWGGKGARGFQFYYLIILIWQEKGNSASNIKCLYIKEIGIPITYN